MDTILKEIDPASDLSEIELSIQTFEAKGAEFQESHIQPHNGRITNIASFEILLPGHRPKELKLREHSTAPPHNGATICWSGVMIVSGTNTAVDAIRPA